MGLSAKKTRRERADKDKAIEKVSKVETKRLNAEIPIDLHSKVKVHAALNNIKITEIVIEALKEYLKKNSNE